MSFLSRLFLGCAVGSMPAAILVAGLVFAAAAPVAPPDYSKGFDLLFEMGLPDVTGWEYVTLEGDSHSYDPFSRQSSSGQGAGPNVMEVLSSGWVEKGGQGAGVRRLMVNGYLIQGTLAEAGDWQALQTAGLPYSGQRPGKPASEANDAKLLVKALQTLGNNEEAKEILLRSPDIVAQLFFRAAHYHRRGLKEDASAAAALLFTLAPAPERLVDLAIYKLASARMELALQQHQRTGDWKALETQLALLVATFTRGWPQRPLAVKLHLLVQQRLKGTPPTIAEGLSPEQQAWWQEVAQGSPARPASSGEQGEPAAVPYDSVDISHLGQMWLLRSKMKANSPEQEISTSEMANVLPWMKAVLTKDWDWIQVMAAALSDDTLVHIASQGNFYGGGDAGDFDFDDEGVEMDELEMDEAWRNMSRPPTRGDLARRFLQAVLPWNDESGDELPTETTEIRALAAEASRSILGKTPTEVARVYLKSGTRQQKSGAMQALAAHGTEADQKQVEELILEQPTQYMQEVSVLLREQKAKGAPFLKKFREAVLAEHRLQSGGDDKETELPEYLAQQFQMLEGLISGRGIEELIADYCAGKITSTPLFRQIQVIVGESEEAWKAAGQAMFAALPQVPKGDGRRKSALLGMSMNYNRDWSPERRSLMQEVLKQDGGAMVPVGRGRSRPLADYVYGAACSLAHPDKAQALQELLAGMDDEVTRPVWEALGKAVLADTALPDLPDAKTVPDARRKEMLAALDAHVGKDWAAYFRALPLNEKLALKEELAKGEPKPAWDSLNRTITQVEIDPPALAGLDAVKKVEAAPGQSLDTDFLLHLAEACRAALAKVGADAAIRCEVDTLSVYQGVRIRFYEEKMLAEDEGEQRQYVVGQAARWIKQAQARGMEEVPIQAYSWVRWRQGSTMAAAHWQQGKDGTWTAWATEEHDTLGQPLVRGEFVAFSDLPKALEGYLKTPPSVTAPLYFFETGAVHTATPTPEAPGS